MTRAVAAAEDAHSGDVDPGLKMTELNPLPVDWTVKSLGACSAELVSRNRALKYGRSDVLTVDNTQGLIPSDRTLGVDFSRYKTVETSDFAYNPMRLNVGSIAMSRVADIALVSPDYVVFRCDPRVLLPQFLDFFRLTSAWRAHIARSGQGSVRIRYYFHHIAAFLVPLPPVAEQRVIAAVLNRLRAAIDATEQVIAATRELKRSLMRHLFMYGAVPVTEADAVALKETEVGRIPDHWSLARFSDVVDIASGQVDPKIPPYNSMVHVGPEHVESSSGRLLPSPTAEEAGVISGKYLFTPEHVIYSKIRPYLRKVALPDFTGVCSADMYPFLAKRGALLKEFLFCYLLTDAFTYQAVSFQSRTGIPKINRQQLSGIPVPRPAIVEQESVADSILSVDAALSAEQSRKSALEALFKTLLHKLMTGEIRVKDWDLEDVA